MMDKYELRILAFSKLIEDKIKFRNDYFKLEEDYDRMRLKYFKLRKRYLDLISKNYNNVIDNKFLMEQLNVKEYRS